MATIKDVAEAAGVSVATVSRAFKPNSRINRDTKETILRIAKRMNYQPKKYRSRQGNLCKFSMIGVIIACHNYPWFNRIMRGINSVMEAEDITPIIADTSENPNNDIICLNKMKNIVRGLIVVSSSELDNYCTNFLSEINETTPVVTMIRNTNIPRIDSIKINGFRPTYDAINLLIENGHRHIGIINGPMVFKPSFDRFAAYTEALKRHNIPIRNEYICYSDFNEDNAYKHALGLIKSNPRLTAIFAANTVIARGCLRAFEKCGLKVPDDIAFISYGDDFSFGLNSIGITVVSDPDYDIGVMAAKLLLRRMKQPLHHKNDSHERIEVTPQIILRGSEVFPKNKKRS